MAYAFNLIPYKDLARGLDLRSAETNVQDGYAEDLQNVDCNSSGHLSKRKGYQGYAGYVPFRVREVTHDGYQINMKLDNGVDLSGLPSSPIIVYGKLPSAEAGDYSTSDSLHYYTGFSVDVRNVFPQGGATLVKSAGDHGYSTSDLFVYVLTSTTDADNSSTWAWPDAVQIDDTTFDVSVTYVPNVTERVYVVVMDKSATSGADTYTADYSGSPIVPSGGVVTGTILASTHGLSNFNIIPKIYTWSGGIYSEIVPDELWISDATGDVTFSFLSASNFTGKVILEAVASDNFKQASIGAGSTSTITISNISTNFPYFALYRLSGGNWERVHPDSMEVNDAGDEVTVSIVNASTSSETYELYYGFATIPANTIRVVDTQATSTTYTGTTVTEPQMTVWGIGHRGRYTDSGGNVTHLDSYKRDAEARLVCGLGGNLFASRTRSEVGSTYQLPQLYVDLDARIGSTVSLAPLFQPTGTSLSVRTRGIITGDNVQNGYALVTGVSYVSSAVADYTLSLVGKAQTLSVGSQISTKDYLTVRGMAHSVHNGTFKIVSVVDAGDDVTIRVENTSLLTADFDETGAAGEANVFTDVFTTTAASNYIVDDVILADSISSGLTLAVQSVSGTSVYVSGVRSQVNLAAGLTVFGRRVSYVQPLRSTSGTANVQYLVKGDMVSVRSLSRQPRVVALHPYHDMPGSIDVVSGVATLTIGQIVDITAVDTAANTFTATAHGLLTNDPVLLGTTSSLPAGLRTDCTYFAKVSDADTFQLTATESGTVIDLTTAGSGDLTVQRVHNLAIGQRLTVSQTGVTELDAVHTVASVPDRSSLTFETTASDQTTTANLVGRTAEFDESLTFTDSLSTPTYISVSDRWIPVEAPSADGDMVRPTYVSHFQDADTNLRSVIVGSSMFLVNQADEVKKFDGENLYQAGLFRWQPALFTQIDTGTASLTLDAIVGNQSTGAPGTGNVFDLDVGDASQFKAGQRIVHNTGTKKIYTVQSVDTTNNKVYTVETITDTADATIRPVKTYKYYFRLNAIDANNNIVASASTGSDDYKVELNQSGQIRHRLVGLPAWGALDYDRIELQVFRVVADTAAPFYLVRSVPVSFDLNAPYIDVYDGTSDEVLKLSGDLDSTMTALMGAELGNAWQEPPRAKHITAVNNRLILANIKDYPQLDIVIRKSATASSVATTDLSGHIMTFRKASTDIDTTTNMTDRVRYQFVTSGDVAINTITRTATTFTVTTASPHSLSVGSWVYLFHDARGVNKSMKFAGWYQVALVDDADTFTVNMDNSLPIGSDVNRLVTATTKTDVPVWLGEDGNFNTIYGNTTGSYEALAMIRLANAINSSMRACTTDGFEAWMTAHAGSEYGLGQLIIRQPKVLDTTLELKVGTIGSNYDVYVNNIKRVTDSEVSATSRLAPSRVLISYENYPEVFDAPFADNPDDSDSAVDVNSADGEEITGVLPFFGESAFGSSQVESLVVVFKTNSIYLLDVKTRQVQKIDSQGLGCTAPASISSTRGGIMFANLSGVYRLNRNLTVSYVGKMVERYWKDSVNAAGLSIATGHNYGIGRQYQLSVPTGDDDSNSVVLVYDHTREGQEQEYGAWTRYTNFPVTAWANLDDDSYFATTDGQVMKIRTANDATDYRDDADAVDDMVIKLKALDSGMPGIRKTTRSIVAHMRMDKTSVTGTGVWVAVDNSETFESAGNISATLGNMKVETYRISVPTPRHVYMQVKFVNSVKDENFVLAGVDLYVAALTNKGVKERVELD